MTRPFLGTMWAPWRLICWKARVILALLLLGFVLDLLR